MESRALVQDAGFCWWALELVFKNATQFRSFLNCVLKMVSISNFTPAAPLFAIMYEYIANPIKRSANNNVVLNRISCSGLNSPYSYVGRVGHCLIAPA